MPFSPRLPFTSAVSKPIVVLFGHSLDHKIHAFFILWATLQQLKHLSSTHTLFLVISYFEFLFFSLFFITVQVSHDLVFFQQCV